MANALGTLFGDIASAIREKTGDTATMKPAEFPEKIAAIEAGGSGGASGCWKTTSVVLTGSWNTRYSVNFGFVPDFIVIYPQKNTAVGTNHCFFIGTSSKCGDIVQYSTINRCIYISSNKFYVTEAYVGIDSTDSNTPINSVTETGFTLGKTHATGNFYVFACKLT